MTDLILKTADTPAEFKFDEDAGQITAYVTTYNNKDVVGDVMAPGVLDSFLTANNYGLEGDEKQRRRRRRRGRKPEDYGSKNVEESILPMLWNHLSNEPIGEWTNFSSDEKGVVGYGQIYTELTRGQDVRALINRGLVGAVSIGFKALDFEVNDDGGRLFKEIELVETSVVLRPANPQARIISAKDDDGRIDIRKVEDALRDVGLSQKERKLLLAGGTVELLKQRDVLDADTRKRDIVNSLINHMR